MGKVCQPKRYGVLGLTNLDLMNQALLMEVGWNLVAKPKGLWAQVLLTKYGVNHENMPQKLPTRYGSHLWRSVGEFGRTYRGGFGGVLGMDRLSDLVGFLGD